MSYITPSNASFAADAVYDVRNKADVKKALRSFNAEFDGRFVFDKGSKLTGKTGGYIINSTEGIGVVGEGVGNHKGEILLSIRGTKSFSDVVTDFNIGTTMSDSNQKIHTGFAKAYKSFNQELDDYLAGKNINKVHIVGHSLGGALATLAADTITSNDGVGAALYTFGSPRVGDEGFAKHFTSKIGAENIFRVHHRADPISMVPVWPFSHVPLPGNDIYLGNSSDQLVAFYHLMKHYDKFVGNSDWETLLRNQPAKKTTHKDIEAWLGTDTFIASVGSKMFMIHEAISYITQKFLKGTIVGAQMGITKSLNAIDFLARGLAEAVKVSKEVTGYISGLLKRILEAIGFAFVGVANLTVEFIRWVLMSLVKTLYNSARMAFQLANLR